MDIEEDIKILKNLKKYLNLLIYEGTHKIIYNDLGWDEKTIDCINAIEHILAEREADKKRIKELEQKNELLKYLYDDCCKCLLDTIEKQKVKDKIEELKKEYEIALEENSTKAFILKCKISALEELLEEK